MDSVQAKSIKDIGAPSEGFVEISKNGQKISIPIRAVSARKAFDLDKKFKNPHPPQKMRKDANGKATGVWFADAADPVYLDLLEDMKTQRVIAQTLEVIVLDDLTEDSLLDAFSIGEIKMIMDAADALDGLSPEEVDEIKNS